MALERAQLAHMTELASHGADILIGALCISAMNVVTDMQSDFLHDPDYVKGEGIPNAKKMIEMAIDQICVVFPDMLLDGGEFDDEIKIEDGEQPFHMLVRGLMGQIMKQRPELMKLEFQPR